MLEMGEYKKILDAVPCGICQVALDEELTILYANPSYYRLYGYTPGDAADMGFTSARFILPEEDYAGIVRAIRGHIKSGEKNFQLEYRGVHSSGKKMWLLIRCVYDPLKPGSMLCSLVDMERQKQLERELWFSVEESRIAYELTDKLMYIFEVEERRLRQSKTAADEFGLAAVVDNVPYSIVNSGAIDGGSTEEYIDFYQSIVSGKPEGEAVVKRRRKDGTFGWYEARFSSIFDERKNPRKAVISYENITEQRAKELTYQKWSLYFKSQEGLARGVYEYNVTKDRMEETGDTRTESLCPLRLKIYSQMICFTAENYVHEADRTRFYEFYDREKLLNRYNRGGEIRDALDYRLRRQDGSFFWVRAIVMLLADPHSRDIKLFMMILEINLEENEGMGLRKHMERDGMTGLLNREAFTQKVTAVLERDEGRRGHALIMLDIDEFKKCNCAYGRPFGDQVILDTACLLKEFMRKDDLCGRIGGDKFMVLLADVSSDADAVPRLNALCRLLKRNYKGKETISCSMGVVFYPRDGLKFGELYRNADIALREGKQIGCGNYRLREEE